MNHSLGARTKEVSTDKTCELVQSTIVAELNESVNTFIMSDLLEYNQPYFYLLHQPAIINQYDHWVLVEIRSDLKGLNSRGTKSYEVTVMIHDSKKTSGLTFEKMVESFLKKQAQYHKVGVSKTTFTSPPCTQQNNGVDCGVYALPFAYFRIHGIDAMIIDLTPEMVNFFRLHFAL